MSTELLWLTYTVALTAVMWIPYILNMIAVRGIVDAVGYPENPPPMAPWAQKMRAAHSNMVENLVVFAALVLTAHAVGISNATTLMACQVFFWARLVHFVAYTFAIPWVRTLAFLVGFGCQVALILQIL